MSLQSLLLYLAPSSKSSSPARKTLPSPSVISKTITTVAVTITHLVIDLSISFWEHVVSKEEGSEMFIVDNGGSCEHVGEQDLAQINLENIICGENIFGLNLPTIFNVKCTLKYFWHFDLTMSKNFLRSFSSMSRS